MKNLKLRNKETKKERQYDLFSFGLSCPTFNFFFLETDYEYTIVIFFLIFLITNFNKKIFTNSPLTNFSWNLYKYAKFSFSYINL